MKRLNGFLESNRGDTTESMARSRIYIPGEFNTSGGMAKSMICANLRSSVSGNTSRIVTEQIKFKLGRVARGKTLHRVSGYDAMAENFESVDKEEDEAERLVAISRVFPKAKNS